MEISGITTSKRIESTWWFWKHEFLKIKGRSGQGFGGWYSSEWFRRYGLRHSTWRTTETTSNQTHRHFSGTSRGNIQKHYRFWMIFMDYHQGHPQQIHECGRRPIQLTWPLQVQCTNQADGCVLKWAYSLKMNHWILGYPTFRFHPDVMKNGNPAPKNVGLQTLCKSLYPTN